MWHCAQPRQRTQGRSCPHPRRHRPPSVVHLNRSGGCAAARRRLDLHFLDDVPCSASFCVFCSLATRVLFCEAPIKTLFVSPLLHTNLSKSLIYSLLGKDFLPVLRISIKSSRPVFLALLVRFVSSREGISFSIGSASSHPLLAPVDLCGNPQGLRTL